MRSGLAKAEKGFVPQAALGHVVPNLSWSLTVAGAAAALPAVTANSRTAISGTGSFLSGQRPHVRSASPRADGESVRAQLARTAYTTR